MSSSRLPRVLSGALRAALSTRRAPLLLSWIITHRCNLRCVYCACPDNLTPELTTTEALDAIDQMAALGTAAVHLTGGEPLIRRDLPTLVARLRFHDIRVSLTSNGTLIPRRLPALSGLSSVALSLDGPPAIHNQNRAAGQVEQVLQALQALRDAHIDRKLQCLVTADTTPDALDFVLTQAERFGARVYFQPALAHVLTTDQENPVVAAPQHLSRIFQLVSAHKKAGRPVGSSQGALHHLGRWPLTHPQGLHCPVNRFALRMTPEGLLLPCHERSTGLQGHSVRGGGFEQAFRALQLLRCTECWGPGRTEIRLATHRGPLALSRVLRQG